MNLPYKSLDFLRTCLAEAGWNKEGSSADKHKRFYLAGKLLAEVLPEVPPYPTPPSDSAMKTDPAVAVAYRKTVEDFNSTMCPDFTLDDKATSCIQACLKFFIDESRLPQGKYSNILVDEFKLLP